MKKRKARIISAVTSAVMMSSLLNCLPVNSADTAVKYRTSYTLYGDVNGDGAINCFDLIAMRKEVANKSEKAVLDLNHDEKVDGDDLVALRDFILGDKQILDAYFYDDADDDGVCDFIEVAVLKTDPDSKDTDGDTLTDYEELVYTKTSPLKKCTDGSTVTDANADPDKDKLTNREEIDLGTDPVSSDSDLDGINDYDEVKVYLTDPKKSDTDGDGIIDGDELTLKLDPAKASSDGSSPDSKRCFEQTIKADSPLLASINKDNEPYELTVEINSAGIASKALSVKTGAYSSVSENTVLGKSVSLSYDEKLSVDSAKVFFKPKNDADIENYMVFEFFPNTNYLLPVETQYSDGKAYVETTELGTYCLVDISELYGRNEVKAVSNAPKPLSAPNAKLDVTGYVHDYTLGETEVVFLVDIANYAGNNLEATKKSIRRICKALFGHCKRGAVTIIGCYMNPVTGDSKLIQYKNELGSGISVKIESVDESLSKMTLYGNKSNPLETPIALLNNLASQFSDSVNNYAFIIYDSPYSFRDTYMYDYSVPKSTREAIENIYDNNIHLNFILSEENYNRRTQVDNLREVCDKLGFGIYSKTSSGDFSHTTCARIFEDALTEIQQSDIVYVSSSATPVTFPEKFEWNAFTSSLPASADKSKIPEPDADGYVDADTALKSVGVKFDENGKPIYETFLEACLKNENTSKGYEQLMDDVDGLTEVLLGELGISPFSDKVLFDDDDGDGIINMYDPDPKHHFGKFAGKVDFKITDSIEDFELPKSIQDIKDTENAHEREVVKERYPFIEEHPARGAAYIAALEAAASATWELGFVADLVTLIWDAGCVALSVIPGVHFTGCHNVNNAAFMLLYYNAEMGGTLAFDAADMVEETDGGKSNFDINTGYMKRAFERALLPGESLVITTTTDCGYSGWEFSGGLFGPHEMDTWASINSCSAVITAECSFDGTTYNATVNYYIVDRYDFYEPNKDNGRKKEVGFVTNDGYVILSYYDFAEPYDVIGSYSTTMTWDAKK